MIILKIPLAIILTLLLLINPILCLVFIQNPRGGPKLKIPASWKKWETMTKPQRVNLVNLLYSLSPLHAEKVGTLVALELDQSEKDAVNEEVTKNRTMHEMARALHVISDSDNISALSKALGRYSRLELDRANSKLEEDLEVRLSFHCCPFFSTQNYYLLLFLLSDCTFRMERTHAHLQRPTGQLTNSSFLPDLKFVLVRSYIYTPANKPMVSLHPYAIQKSTYLPRT